MNEQKHIIWSSDVDYEDWRADLEEQYPDLSEQERMELMVEQNNDYLDDERCNLNIQLSRPILLIADIGRWDGRYPGYRLFRLFLRQVQWQRAVRFLFLIWVLQSRLISKAQNNPSAFPANRSLSYCH